MFAVTKDPAADLDYSFDWTAWLNGDTIVTSTWTLQTGSGMTSHATSISGGDHTITWLSGGTIGGPYRVTNRITTTAGRIDDRSFEVTISDL